mgnify:CR=1 FL=1
MAVVEIDVDREVAHYRRQALATPGLLDPGGHGVPRARRGDLVLICLS